MRRVKVPWWLAPILALVLAGCGDEEASVSAPTVEPTEGQQAAITSDSGCWTDDQRPEGEAEDMARKQYAGPPAMAIDPAKRYTATLETNKGAIEVELYPGDAPQTVNNFVCLARDGYYDGTPFHRIVAGFVIQGGDPTGTGSGGPGYQFNDEPVVREYEPGTLAMANAGKNTNGSQFFITLADLRGSLPKNYTIFGRVIGGQEAVDAIAAVPTRPSPSGERSQPTESVTLDKVTIHEA
jgi:cyclophilin family peptidyl-prolyl cis-trans isomerase